MHSLPNVITEHVLAKQSAEKSNNEPDRDLSLQSFNSNQLLRQSG